MFHLDEECRRVKDLLRSGEYYVSDYSVGDQVQCIWNRNKKVEGKVILINHNGGGIYDGVSPSFDILGSDGILYKHISIVDVYKG